MEPSQGIIKLQQLEHHLHDLVHPFINQPHWFQSRNSSSIQLLKKELWITLNAGGKLIIELLQAAEQSVYSTRNYRSLNTLLSVWFSFRAQKIVEQIDQAAPPFNPDEFSIGWLKQANTIWKEKLAGLYLQDDDWTENIIVCLNGELGPLKGSTWITLLDTYVTFKNQHIKSLKTDV